MQWVRISWGFVAWKVDAVGEVDFGDFGLYVFGDVYEDWSWSACGGDVEGGFYGLGDFCGFGWLIVVFGYWGGYADYVRFLKGVSAYHVAGVDACAGDLSCYGYDGRRVHGGGGDACDEVCGAWTRGGEAYAWFAAGACVAVRSVCGALFVSA